MDIPSMFERSVDRTPDRDAIVDIKSDTRYSYRELADETYAVANGLADRGVSKGTHVATCLPNRPEHGMTVLATQLLGAVAVPFNFRLAANAVKYHVEDSRAEVLVFDQMVREAVETAHENGADVDTFVYVGEDPPSFAIPFSELRDSSSTPVDTQIDHDDRSVILYTSGTTGDPKGVPLDHRASVARVLSNTTGQRYYLRESVLSAMPLYHTIGLHGVFLTMMCTSGNYITSPAFDPEEYAQALNDEPVTGVYEAPTIFNNVVQTEAIESFEPEGLDHVIYGGAPMSTSLYETVRELFDPEQMIHLYGNTEMYDPLSYEDPMKYGKTGLFHRTRIVEIGANDPQQTVEQGEEGELIVHMDSPTAFEAYWNKPDETDAAIVDDWFFTGDAAYEDESGHIMVTGRADDLIISGGENIHPVEVEDVLTAHPDIVDAAVIGVQDDEWGERVKAFVQVDPDAERTADDFDQWCLDSDDLSDFKRPREYEFVEEIPRNPSGKIMRYKLR